MDRLQRLYRRSTHKRVMALIGRIRDSFPTSLDVYKNGSCIRFCMILREVFPDGVILWDGDHAVFEICDRRYDIDGETSIGERVTLGEHGFGLMRQALHLRWTPNDGLSSRFNFILEEAVFRSTALVIVGSIEYAKEIVSCRRECPRSVRDDYIEALGGRPCGGMTSWHDDDDGGSWHFVYLSRLSWDARAMEILAHEVSHLTHNILCQRGMYPQQSAAYEEVCAYYSGFAVRRILEEASM